MATMNFIKGTFKGRFGQFVGSSWKGKDYVKTFTPPANPRTPGQVAVRGVFAHIAHIAKGINQPVLRPYTFPKPPKQTEYNVFMHVNRPLFADKVWDPSRLKLFEGPLFNPGLDGAVYDAGEQWVTVYWDNADKRGEDTDMGVSFVYSETAGEVLGAACDERIGSELKVLLNRPMQTGERLHAYLAFSQPPTKGTGEPGQVSMTSHRRVTLTREGAQTQSDPASTTGADVTPAPPV